MRFRRSGQVGAIAALVTSAPLVFAGLFARTFPRSDRAVDRVRLTGWYDAPGTLYTVEGFSASASKNEP